MNQGLSCREVSRCGGCVWSTLHEVFRGSFKEGNRKRVSLCWSCVWPVSTKPGNTFRLCGVNNTRGEHVQCLEACVAHEMVAFGPLSAPIRCVWKHTSGVWRTRRATLTGRRRKAVSGIGNDALAMPHQGSVPPGDQTPAAMTHTRPCNMPGSGNPLGQVRPDPTHVCVSCVSCDATAAVQTWCRAGTAPAHTPPPLPHKRSTRRPHTQSALDTQHVKNNTWRFSAG